MLSRNPYYAPEMLDLEMLSAEKDLSYEFNIIAFWRDKVTGIVYTATDSGCS